MPRGNKDIKKHGFKVEGRESYNKRVSVWVTESMFDALGEIDNKAEFIREAIREKLDKEKES